MMTVVGIFYLVITDLVHFELHRGVESRGLLSGTYLKSFLEHHQKSADSRIFQFF